MPRPTARRIAGAWLAVCVLLLIGSPRAVAAAPDKDSISIRMTPRDIYPPVPVADLAGTPGSEGQALLQWTAPDESHGVAPKAVPVVSYDVRVATFSITDLLGNTTAWFTAASTLTAPSPGSPGSAQALLTTLEGGVTYYFGLRSADDDGNTSDLDSNAHGGGSQAKVPVKGVRGVTDLNAASGAGLGEVDLSWTTPSRLAHTDPLSYEIRVSTLGNIDNNGAFNAALSLSSFSATPPPSVGAPNTPAALTVTGLNPGTTYYFAVRAKDSSGPAMVGRWLRGTPAGFNLNNYARAKFLSVPPNAVTDLAAGAAAGLGNVRLTWTAPTLPGGVPVSYYTVRFSTKSVADFGGDANAWYANAPSTTVVVASTATTGQQVVAIASGIASGVDYYFGLKSTDQLGQTSAIDTRSAGVFGQATFRLPDLADLAANAGPVAGSVRLTWTEQSFPGTVPPLSYVIKASSVANIDDDAAFDAALPLSAFSPATPPAPGPGGSPVAFDVTGLTPTVTYYFALRVVDSDSPQFRSSWVRDVLTGVNASNFHQPLFVPNPPDPVADLAAAPGTAEGEIKLSWTAPRNQNYVALSSYTVRYATFSVASLGGDTTAWFSAAPGAILVFPAKSSGSAETLTLSGLFPASTFYFGIKAIDALNETGPIDSLAAGTQAKAKPLNLPPGTPSGLTASPGLNQASVSWNGLPASAKGLDFAGYRLYRSTLPASNFAVAAATAGVAFADHPLTAFVTYYYRVTGIDAEGLESPVSSTVSVIPFTLGPQEPFGLRMSAGPTTATMSWSTTTRFADGTSFIDPLNPTADELLGYQISRSTDVCAPFTTIAVKAATATSHTDNTGGLTYFYRIQSFNSLGVSTGTPTLDLSGSQIYPADDCYSRAIVDKTMVTALSKSSNTYGQDILLSRDRRPEETGGKVLQSVDFRPLVGGVAEARDFHFPKPIKVQLHFMTVGGQPVPQSAGPLAAPAAGQPAAASVNDLGLFWHNGIEFKKLYGKVDPLNQTVTAETPNVGKFQIRAIYRDSGVTFDLSNITSRIFSPNGDGLNDVVLFLFDNPRGSFVEGKVFDLRGAFVANMQPGPQPDSLMWDGRMNGRYVSNGVYLYEIRGEGKTFNGTVVVAR